MDRDPGDEPPETTDQIKRDLKSKILAAIAEHLRAHGPRNWKLVRERPAFAAVIGEQAGEAGRRKFYRWLRSVRRLMAADKTRPHEGRAAADEALADATERARAAAARHLPAAPSPAFFLKLGADADVMVNMVEAGDEVWSDLQLARAEAFEPDGSGGLRVKSPKLLVASANSRLSMLERTVRLVKEMYDLDTLRRSYQAIIEIIVSELAEVPEIQALVLDRLQALNNAQALTPFAQTR